MEKEKGQTVSLFKGENNFHVIIVEYGAKSTVVSTFPPPQCIFRQKKIQITNTCSPKSMHGSLTIQKFRHTPALLTYILTKMPYHRHLNRAVRITCGLWYRWNELNHECGLHTECTQNFRSEQTELITF